MKLINKRIQKMLGVLALTLAYQSTVLAQNDNTLGAEAYLSVETWGPSEK